MSKSTYCSRHSTPFESNYLRPTNISVAKHVAPRMKREPLILPCNRSAAKIDAAPPSSPTDSGDLPIYRGCRSREGCTCLTLFLIVPQARIVLTTLVLPCLAGAPDTCRRVAWQGPETSLQSRGDHELCPRLHQVPLFQSLFHVHVPEQTWSEKKYGSRIS